MGYTEASIVQAAFRIPFERQESALESVLRWLRDDLGYELPVTDLGAAFRLFGIAPVHDESGDVVDLEFDGVLLVETDDLFERVARHVEPGSHVDWRGGRGNTWRYVFTGEELRRTDVAPGAPRA